MNKNTLLAFVNLGKAIDKDNWRLQLTSLDNAGIDSKSRRFIFRLNKKKATVIGVID